MTCRASPRDRIGAGRAAACAAIAAACLAAPAGAAGLFTPPAGCHLILTVQERSCSVSQHYRCDADPAGDQHAAYFGKGGQALFVSHIDAETRWLASSDPQTGVSDRLEDGAADDASLTALMDGGLDRFDFHTVGSDGTRLRHAGQDRLTGEVVTIDGQPLDRTAFVLTTIDTSGRVVVARQGHQHISRELRLFFGGLERETDADGTSRSVDHSPVRLIRPGQPGFASTEPQYDCEVLTAALSPAGGAR